MIVAIRLMLFLTLLLGVIYPVAVTAAAQTLFPRQANGDPDLVGRLYDRPDQFWGRPSAVNYQAASSSGSNLGPREPKRLEAHQAAVQALGPGQPPEDLVTASGSGLDPHITPEAAFFQVERVAQARHLEASKVEALVRQFIEEPSLGFLGHRRVNVVRLNTALDHL